MDPPARHPQLPPNLLPYLLVNKKKVVACIYFFKQIIPFMKERNKVN